LEGKTARARRVKKDAWVHAVEQKGVCLLEIKCWDIGKVDRPGLNGTGRGRIVKYL